MSDVVFDAAKGRVLGWAAGINDTDSLVLILIQAAGIEDDSTMVRQATVADLLGVSTEQEMGRITITGTGSVTDAVDTLVDTAYLSLVDSAQTWAGTTGSDIGAVVVAYAPASATTDADLIPITKHDLVFTPDGTDLVVDFGAAFYGAT